MLTSQIAIGYFMLEALITIEALVRKNGIKGIEGGTIHAISTPIYSLMLLKNDQHLEKTCL